MRAISLVLLLVLGGCASSETETGEKIEEKQEVPDGAVKESEDLLEALKSAFSGLFGI